MTDAQEIMIILLEDSKDIVFRRGIIKMALGLAVITFDQWVTIERQIRQNAEKITL